MFRLSSASFQEQNQDVVRQIHTILTYSEEQFCLSLLESSDEKLKWNIQALEKEGLDYVSIMFTNSEGLGLFVKTDFAINAMFSEAHYRSIKC